MVIKFIAVMYLLTLCQHTIYCRCVSIPLLDDLLSEIESRFSTHQQTAFLGLSLVLSIMVSLSLEECTTKIFQLAEMYHENLPSRDCVEGELHCWWMKWQQELSEDGQVSLPSTATHALLQCFPTYEHWLVFCACFPLPVAQQKGPSVQ